MNALFLWIVAWLAPAWGSPPPELVPRELVSLGAGAVLGGMLGPTQLETGFSPSAIAAFESGRGRVRGHIGGHTAPTFLWVAGNQSIGAQLAMFDAGFTLGNERVRVGPYGTVGLLGVGAGLRAVLTPTDTRKGNLRGIEVRMTWFAPRTGNVGLYYVHAKKVRNRQRGAWVARPERQGFCRRVVVGLGGAVAVSSTSRAWEFIGQDIPTQASGSPAVAVACERAGRVGGWHLGAETAPAASYRVPTSDGGADRKLFHMGSVTVGAFVGGDSARVGPIVTAGVWALGGGLRALVTTARSDNGTLHGLELRALVMVPSAPAVEGMALVHFTLDPRRARGDS